MIALKKIIHTLTCFTTLLAFAYIIGQELAPVVSVKSQLEISQGGNLVITTPIVTLEENDYQSSIDIDTILLFPATNFFITTSIKKQADSELSYQTSKQTKDLYINYRVLRI